jgi:lysophospholipase L1-like esterase
MVAAAALAPVLYMQGRRVRRRVLRLPEPPGPREGLTGRGPRVRVLILGDSSAAGVGAPHQDQALLGQVVSRLARVNRVEWMLLAKSGATTSSIRRALPELGPRAFDVVVTSLGVNDVTAGRRSSEWLAQQAALRADLRSRLGVGCLVVCGLPPVHAFPALPKPLRWYLGGRARAFDRALRNAVAAEQDCSFLELDLVGDVSDMAPDGFHPGPGIYEAWGLRVAERIQERVGAARECPKTQRYDRGP